MELFNRKIQTKAQQLATKFPFVTLTGPRQSGKSTLAKMTFPDYKIVSLEDLDMRLFASDDPHGFINTFPGETIIDEVQRVPSLLSYLQTYSDRQDTEGLYILTGSQNSTLMSAIDQSLAGRTALLTLLPLSVSELSANGICPKTVNEQIFFGGYPRIFAKEIDPTDFYPSYITTYVERDIRQLIDIANLDKFVKFIKLCAGRIGQLLNKSSLANETGVSVPTVDSWLSILQASYIVYLLQPYHENFSKRLTKSPKLYFYDTGVACSLLEIGDAKLLESHYLRGGLFENMVINELLKHYLNLGIKPSLSFWRDSSSNEIDIVDTTGGNMKIYEVKSGSTFSSDYFKGLAFMSKLTSIPPEMKTVVYNGAELMKTSNGIVMPWNKFLQI